VAPRALLQQAIGHVELQFRWNNREAESMFMLVVAALVIGTGLPYDMLIAKSKEVSEGEVEILTRYNGSLKEKPGAVAGPFGET